MLLSRPPARPEIGAGRRPHGGATVGLVVLVLLPAVPVLLHLRRERIVVPLVGATALALGVAATVIGSGRRADSRTKTRANVRDVLVSMLLPVALAAVPPALAMALGLVGWLVGERVVAGAWRSPLERLFLSCGDIVVMRWIRAAAIGAPTRRRLGTAIETAVLLRFALAALALVVLYAVPRLRRGGPASSSNEPALAEMAPPAR